MVINDKIVVKNYKCFDSTGGGFERILPINVIIGKNNSGKSSLIDLVEFLINTKSSFLKLESDGQESEVMIAHPLSLPELDPYFKVATRRQGIDRKNDKEFGIKFIGTKYNYLLLEDGQKKFLSVDDPTYLITKDLFQAVTNSIEKPFRGKRFCHITAERDIVPEIPGANHMNISPNGIGATNYIQAIINEEDRDSDLIEKGLLNELNTIINPDIKFSRILVQKNKSNVWEIYFVNSSGLRVALSKMGSGIKTVLLVLLNLVVRPLIEKRNLGSYVFAFEELENNLHPSLQRRLYNYIRRYSENNSAYFFLTTHSNIVIDAFGTYENAQIIHVSHDGDKATTSTISSFNGTKNILYDLGIKASDILQSNGIIWVEGPSDRNYINRWIEILAPDLKEGFHYSIMFYGGRLLARLSFDHEWFNTEFIPLLRINTNAFVVIDRDGERMTPKLNETKKRINKEIGDDNCWITKGREIENYLSDETIKKWLLEKHGYESDFINDKNTKIEASISNSNEKIKLQYHLNKTVYSSEIAEFIMAESIDVLELRGNMENLILQIRKWNS